MIVVVAPLMVGFLKIGDIQEKGSIIKKEVEGHLIEKINRVKVIQEEEDPLIMEDHLMMEDPQEMEDHLEDLENRATRPPRTSWTSTSHNSAAT